MVLLKRLRSARPQTCDGIVAIYIGSVVASLTLLSMLPCAAFAATGPLPLFEAHTTSVPMIGLAKKIDRRLSSVIKAESQSDPIHRKELRTAIVAAQKYWAAYVEDHCFAVAKGKTYDDSYLDCLDKEGKKRLDELKSFPNLTHSDLELVSLDKECGRGSAIDQSNCLDDRLSDEGKKLSVAVEDATKRYADDSNMQASIKLSQDNWEKYVRYQCTLSKIGSGSLSSASSDVEVIECQLAKTMDRILQVGMDE